MDWWGVRQQVALVSCVYLGRYSPPRMLKCAAHSRGGFWDEVTYHIAETGSQVLGSCVQRYDTARACRVEREAAGSQVVEPAYSRREDGRAGADRFVFDRQVRILLQDGTYVVGELTREYAGVAAFHVLEPEAGALHCLVDIFHCKFCVVSFLPRFTSLVCRRLPEHALLELGNTYRLPSAEDPSSPPLCG